jgi:SAM-dependent methyltransferase
MSNDRLPRSAFRARIQVENRLPTLAAGEISHPRVKVKNVSSKPWPTRGEHAVNLSYHWYDPRGHLLVRDGLRTPLPFCVEPGQEVALDCMVQAPERAGPLELEFDVVQEGVSWFRRRGSATCRLRCDVLPAMPTCALRFTGDCTAAEFQAACARQDWWYHSYYFDNGFAVVGDYDIGKNIHEYGFPDDMSGMTVLDVGTGGGWFALYCEQRGAQVTALDVRGTCDYDAQGRFANPPVEAEKPVPDAFNDDGRPIYFSRVSRGFWIMRQLLRSKVRYVNARVYDLHPAFFGGQKFDLVFMGALLLHLRDPVGALMAARSVCGDRLLATTGTLIGDGDDPRPRMELLDMIWWYPNKACFRRWFLDAGFRQVDVDRAVTLSAEKQAFESFDHPGVRRNCTQILQVGDARV